MPLRKPVKRLQDHCIQVIIRNMDVYPMEEIRSLPTSLLEELIKFTHDKAMTLVMENEVVKLCIHYKIQMITENITRLSFLIWPQINVEHVIKSIPKHFKNLKQFAIESCASNFYIKLTHQEIVNLVLSFPNIIDLKLDFCNVNDNILELIGDNCPNLECLVLPYCRVTDAGISRLCDSKSRGCNIKHLRLGRARGYTIKGCLMALQNLKQLRFFKVRDAFEVFEMDCFMETFKKLFQDLNGSQELPTFLLCKLPKIYMGDMPTGFLNFLLKCCPNVSKLHVQISDDLANDVNELKKCEKILNLAIYIIKKEFSMSDLSDVGSKVTSFVIYRSDVDLELIGLICPNLKKLDLSDVTYQPIVKLKRKTCVMPFENLQKLILCEDSHLFSTHFPQLRFLFQNCVELERLKIYNLITDDDDVENFFRIIREINPLTHLTHFTICGRQHRVYKPITLELLKMENNLQFVSLFNGFSTEFETEIESYIKENNLSTDVIFPD